MKTWQKLILALSTVLIVIGVFVLVSTFVVNRVVGDKEQTKRWLYESGLYASVSTSIKNQFSQNNATVSQISNTVLDKSVDRTITEQKIQQIVEDNLNNTYAWLEGETASLQINIGAEELQTEFANNVADELRILARSLPTCSRTNPPVSTDITTINCIPPGYPIEAEIEKIRASIVSGDIGQLGNELNIQDLNITTSQDQQPFYQAYAPVKTYYQLSRILQTISGVAFAVCALVILLLSQPKYRALRTFATTLVPYGILYLLAGLLVPRLITTSFDALAKQANGNTYAEPIQNIAQSISALVGSLLTRIGVAMLVAGLILFIVYKFIQKKHPVDQQLEQT
jgi:predicted PurR-regulated permease PerM